MRVFHSTRCDVRFDASTLDLFDTAVPAAVIKKGREHVLGSSAQKPAHATSGDDDLHTFNHNRRVAVDVGQERQVRSLRYDPFGVAGQSDVDVALRILFRVVLRWVYDVQRTML